MNAETFSVTPNRAVTEGGTSFAHRHIGPRIGIPILLLDHPGATWATAPAVAVACRAEAGMPQ